MGRTLEDGAGHFGVSLAAIQMALCCRSSDTPLNRLRSRRGRLRRSSGRRTGRAASANGPGSVRVMAKTRLTVTGPQRELMYLGMWEEVLNLLPPGFAPPIDRFRAARPAPSLPYRQIPRTA